MKSSFNVAVKANYLLIILDSFHWLAAFDLDLLQAILFISI
jgi:hypothetical protein